jgi:LacI family transcriptional regulator
MNNNVSIKDIAKMAGVSIATVSRVINKSGKVAKETEEKILQIMKENNYVPNLLAKGMRTNKVTTIGIVIPDISNEFFSKIAKQIQTLFFNKGYASIICNTSEDDKIEKQCIEMLQAQQVGGIIHIVSEKANKENKILIPTVYLDREPKFSNKRKDMAIIESDNLSGGYIATDAMIKKGCKNIICLSPKDVVSTHKKRCQGYAYAMNENGLNLKIIIVDNVSLEEGYNKTKEYIKNNKIDGIFATTDIIAIGAIKEAGFKIPENVKVFGYDASNMSEVIETPLSTIVQPIEEMTLAAVEMLEKNMNGEKIKENRLILPVKIKER